MNTLVKAEESRDPVHDPLGDVKVEILKTEADLNPEIIIGDQMIPQGNTDIKQEDELVVYEETLLENHSSDSDNTDNDDDDDDDLPLAQAFNKHVPTKPKLKQTKASYYQPKIRRSQYDAFIKEHYKINCNHCLQPFECFSALEDHFRIVHNERAYVICCDTKMFKAGLLVDHLNYHNNPEYFKCLHCDKTFQLRRRLLTHLKTHKELKYCCEICGRKFLDKKKLERHKITHMSAEEKKFPCKECGKL